MYTFTNRFSSPNLKQRIAMLNQAKSNRLVWGRYGLWLGVIGLILLACQHERQAEKISLKRIEPIAPTNATRRHVRELDADEEWYIVSAFPNRERTLVMNGRRVKAGNFTAFPNYLCIRNNRLALELPTGEQTKVYINGKEATINALEQLTFDEVAELFMYSRRASLSRQPDTDRHRILISTTHRPLPNTADRRDMKQFLMASAITNNPFGEANTFSMNRLLEATFFQDKRAFVERTKDDHLSLLPDYQQDIDVYINGLDATPADIKTIHIREVDRLYTSERSYKQWLTNTPNRLSRYILYIQTTPKRAKRDSSYYVFSPFYTGDF
ncbi:hypothetical protein [Spirosoma montaniterrae]|uniref:Uncharacterized protein n=1 Tax=Spirosoma montaniterrae TaxID=1178516 RepID=A0A1P9X1Y4_9BACT|nr:hypothetical protein [Spirosoma montaniterrae]AQG81608.1 hypothetical protein AWR27_21225 [Spirosoma montaniterrae]